MTQDEKLLKFFDISMDDVNKQNVILVEEYKNELQHKYDEYVKAETARAETKLQNMLESYRREKKSEMSDKQMKQRRENIEKKNEYIDEIFSEVVSKLQELKNKPEYKEMLVSQINNALSYRKDGDNIMVYIDESDSIYKDELEEITGCEITIADKNILGGITAFIPMNNISFDESFASKIAEAKKNFVF